MKFCVEEAEELNGRYKKILFHLENFSDNWTWSEIHNRWIFWTMLIFVRIETHAVIFSGISVRIVDLASEAFWSHFVRIGTRHFDQNLAKSVRIGTRDPLGMSWVLVSLPPIHGNAAGNEPTGSYRNCTAILMRCGFKVRRLHNNFLSVTVF